MLLSLLRRPAFVGCWRGASEVAAVAAGVRARLRSVCLLCASRRSRRGFELLTGLWARLNGVAESGDLDEIICVTAEGVDRRTAPRRPTSRANRARPVPGPCRHRIRTFTFRVPVNKTMNELSLLREPVTIVGRRGL